MRARTVPACAHKFQNCTLIYYVNYYVLPVSLWILADQIVGGTGLRYHSNRMMGAARKGPSIHASALSDFPVRFEFEGSGALNSLVGHWFVVSPHPENVRRSRVLASVLSLRSASQECNI